MKGVGRCIYGIGSVKIGPLFFPKMEGQNLQKKKLKKKLGVRMARNRRERCAF